MSRETTTTLLLGEVYEVLYGENNFIMDPRRVKRLITIDRFAETLTKGAIAHSICCERRLEKRK